jgi:hypothetical protein
MRRAVPLTAALWALSTPAQSAANQVPVTQPDFYTLPSTNPALVVPAPGILANDTDPDGDPITAELFNAPTYGTLDLHADGSFTYVPPAGFSGLVSFDYLARDTPTSVSQCCGHAYIGVTRPPIANDDAYAALNSTPRIVPAPGVLENDVGADFAALETPPAHGTIDFRASGRFTYTAAAGFVGNDSFTYSARVRGEPKDVATVSLRVKASNAQPVGTTDTFATAEDTPLSVPAPGVLANDTDPDGDPLTVELVSDPFGDYFDLLSDGSFEYLPPPDYDSPVTFSYRIDDGLVTSPPITATIDITAVNDSPIAEDDEYQLLGGRVLDVPAPGVLANDSDPVESDNLLATLITPPRRGKLEFRLDGSFTYKRHPREAGPVSFTYLVKDSGGAVGNTAVVTIFP